MAQIKIASVAARNAVTAQKIASASPVTTTSSSWGSSSGSSKYSANDIARITATAQKTGNATALNALKSYNTWSTSDKWTSTSGFSTPSQENWLKFTRPTSQTGGKSIFSDTILWSTKNQYTWEGIMDSTGKEITDFSKPFDMKKELDVYWEAARIKDKQTPWTIATRNDTIAYNLKSAWINTQQWVADYLAKQAWFQNATQEEQQNTIKSISARMWINTPIQADLTKEEMITQEQDALTVSYQAEQNKLIAEWHSQDVVKRMDNLLWQEIRNLTDVEIRQIALDTGIAPEQVKATSEEWAKARQRMADPFQQKEQDLETENLRNVEDAKIQLQRTEQKINDSVADITTNMERDLAWWEKVGALKWYVQSSGYMQGLNNIKTDAQKLVWRLNTQLQEANTDTAKYINRTNTDFATNMDRIQKSFTDDLLNLRMAGTNEVNSLLTKYSPSEKLMTKELDRLTNEYWLKSMALYKAFQENFKWITDTAMYESEKIQQFQIKQRELENMTLSQLYANDWMALMNMTDTQIQSLADQGYINQSQVATLKSAREWAKQQFNLKQTASNIDVAKLWLEQKKINAELWIVDTTQFAQNVASLPDWIPWWQCVKFVNDWLEWLWLWRVFGTATMDEQTLENKISHKNSDVPTPWSVIIRTSPTQPKAWDIAFVTSVNPDWTITLKWSNAKWEEKTYTQTINANDKSIKGYFDPKLATKTNSKAEQAANAILSQWSNAKLSDYPIADRPAIASILAHKKDELLASWDIYWVMAASAWWDKLGDTSKASIWKLVNVINQIWDINRLLSEWDKNITDSNWNKIDISPITWWLRWKNPWDTNAQELKATLQATVPNLARWVYWEVWVLTDNDIANYIKTIPNLTQTKDVQTAILAMTLRTLRNSLDWVIENNSSAWVDMSWYKLYYKKLNDKITELDKSIWIWSQQEWTNNKWTWNFKWWNIR